MKLNTKVSEDQAFYVQNGPAIKSVKELADALENDTISDEAFQYHVSNNNNDFINWIAGVYENEDLAKSLKRVKTKKTFLKKLKDSL
ncbi:MAG: hypothetical protein ACNS62_11320 [Candidatus Cyclobacteriaceae bacterium M3_2C_046]